MAKQSDLWEREPWRGALAQAADPERAKGFLTQLANVAAEALADATAEDARVLCAVLSGSPFLANTLVQRPEWLQVVRFENVEYPRRDQGLQREVRAFVEPALEQQDYEGALSRLREFKQREMLRVAARDLARLARLPDVTREITDIADVCLAAVLQICQRRWERRFGQPYHLNPQDQWEPTAFVVIGLGKLGGRELNYSSDVDVVFVYTEEGHVFRTPPTPRTDLRRALTNHQFFKRLAEDFIAEVSRTTGQGMLFRIDVRLRPEGETGPLVRSLESYETYYAQWGQTWERMMLIKARPVAGDHALGAEFLEMIQPFRYPRYLYERALPEVAALKRRIEREVVRQGELERNVKLGRGGIREIEFLTQALQMLHGGRMPFLQESQTLPALQKLVQYDLIPAEDATSLTEAYCFLRNVEHRLQMEQNLQTHVVPTDRAARQRLAKLLGLEDAESFDRALKQHQECVRRIYERVLGAELPDTMQALPGDFDAAEAGWKALLAEHGFKEVDKAFRLLKEFAHGPGFVHVSSRTTELAMQLVPRLLALCPQPDTQPPENEPDPQRKVLSHPDRVLTRLDSFVSAYGARATLFETWTRHPALFELLLLLFDRSEYLAEMAIRVPDLVDAIVLSGQLYRRKSAAQILKELREGSDDPDQHRWVRRYHRAEQMRIGLRDILGLADYEQSLFDLSELADACLQYALEVVLKRHRRKRSPLVIVGLGKLGGRELSYGSDLDIVFVADPRNRDLARLQKLAVALMDLLGTMTEDGKPFELDARLRPDGEKGLLVNTLDAYEEYYRRRAQLWEIQALVRTRPVAGDLALGEQFQQVCEALADFREENVQAGFPLKSAAKRPRGRGRASATGLGLEAYSPDWRQKIAHMRQRIEKERTPQGKDELAIKTGCGGLMDAEFIAQTLCLAQGWHEANTRQALERALKEGALPAEAGRRLLECYRHLLRVECILRRWSFEGEVLLPDDPAPFYRVSIRCGFSSPDRFRQALGHWRQTIREVYRQVLPAAS